MLALKLWTKAESFFLITLKFEILAVIRRSKDTLRDYPSDFTDGCVNSIGRAIDSVSTPASLLVGINM